MRKEDLEKLLYGLCKVKFTPPYLGNQERQQIDQQIRQIIEEIRNVAENK